MRRKQDHLGNIRLSYQDMDGNGSIDPITHHNYSPYQAFDNNPIFWADPSGADSETDQYGRARFDRFGMYIAPNDRGEKNYEHTNEKTKNSTYQISEKVTVSQSVVFFPEREGDNRGDQLIETTINTIKRFSQDKKIIETNETIVYSTLINDDYIILSNKKFNATTINIYGQGGKKEKTIERPIMDVNVDAAQMFEEQAKFVDKTINTSREYNKAIPILVQEFNSRALDRYGNGVSFSIPFFKSFRITPTVAAIKSLALEIRSLKPSSIKAQYRYSSTRATMLRKVERIKF